METRIRDIRQSKGMTQEMLSSISGVHRVLIAKYELGNIMPSMKNAYKIATALDVPIQELIGDCLPGDVANSEHEEEETH